MGCCEGRSGQPLETTSYFSNNASTKPSIDASRIIKESLSLYLPTSDEIIDAKALDILDYISELEQNKSWHHVHEEAQLIVFKLDKSKYNDENMVTKVKIDIGIIVPVKIALEYLTTLEFRRAWDFFIENIEIIDGDEYNGVLHRKVKLLFYRAEFVEKQIVLVENDKVFVVTYSLGSDEYKDKHEKPRDINIMTAFIISDNQHSTEITVINQMGHTNYIKNFTSTIGINQQKQWMQKLKRKIRAHLENEVKLTVIS